MDDDLVFKALADPTRRRLLDALFEADGRSLGDLERVVAEHAEMTRFGVAKHLRVLADADLVVVRKSGRERLHYLNPVPIQAIHDRWIDKYARVRASALLDLKHALERPGGRPARPSDGPPAPSGGSPDPARGRDVRPPTDPGTDLDSDSPQETQP